MRAVMQHQYGDSDQWEIRETADPVPGPDEVLVQVHAAGVDRGTWHLMTGLPFAIRLGFGLRRPKHAVPGRDVAGVVLAVGDEVTSVSVGDEVMGTADGSFAELALVPESRLAPKPASLTFDEAAVLPVSGLTAIQAVRDAGRVGRGDRVLVIGASGGVGTHAVQIAAALGAEVTGVASGAKADLVRSAGAVRVIDYTSEEIETDGRYDVIIDTGGLRPLRQLRRSLAPTGTLVIVGGEGGGRWLGGAHRQLGAMVLSLFVRQRLTALMSQESAGDLLELERLVEDGHVKPALERTFGLDEAAQAIDHVAAGHARGKVAITL